MGTRKKNSSVTLKLEGELNIQRAAEIKVALLNHVSKNAETTVDHSDATDIDLTYLQLLISAKKFAGENNKVFNVLPGNKMLEATLELSGIRLDEITQ